MKMSRPTGVEKRRRLTGPVTAVSRELSADEFNARTAALALAREGALVLMALEFRRQNVNQSLSTHELRKIVSDAEWDELLAEGQHLSNASRP